MFACTLQNFYANFMYRYGVHTDLKKWVCLLKHKAHFALTFSNFYILFYCVFVI